MKVSKLHTLTLIFLSEKQLFSLSSESDLKKTEEHVMVEKAKADSRTQNMKFLKNKSEDFKFRIKAAEVGVKELALLL